MRSRFAVLALFLSLSAPARTFDLSVTPPAALGTEQAGRSYIGVNALGMVPSSGPAMRVE